MASFKTSGTIAITLLFAGSLLGGCAITTRSFQGTSETVENTAEASTKLSSSTSPRSSDDDEEKHRPVREGEPDVDAARKFLEVNLAKVREDAARGGGEYLASVGLMLGVRHERITEFEHIAKVNYSEIFSDPSQTAAEVVISLNEAVRRYPWLRSSAS